MSKRINLKKSEKRKSKQRRQERRFKADVQKKATE